MSGEGTARAQVARDLLVKVPEVTIYFWIVKILTTGMGESTSDWLVRTLFPPVAVLIGLAGFAAALWLQFRAPRYSAWVYWLAVTAVSVFGTMCADVLHVGLHIPYIVSTGFFAIALAVVFTGWRRSEHTLSIHSIFTPRRESFYWLAVVTTFALGTASGDLTARTFGLGFLGSGIMFAAAFAVPAIAWRWFGLNSILAFWWAYVLTRPLGASFADWMSARRSWGGLGWGYGTVSLSLTVLIVAFVAYLALSRLDVPGRQAATARPASGGELRLREQAERAG